MQSNVTKLPKLTLTGRIRFASQRLGPYARPHLDWFTAGIVAATGVTGNGSALAETLPPPELSFVVVLAGWVVFSVGLVLAFNAEPGVLVWLVPGVIGTPSSMLARP